MPVEETVWKPDPHTLAKLAILERYLQAWLPIMSKYNGRILYIDGFAGPGKYLDDNDEPTIDGSPLVAIKAAINHIRKFKAEIVFFFVEVRSDRCEFLDGLLASITLHNSMKCHIVCSTFDEHLSTILDSIEEQKKRMAPAFVFMDPFGYSHTPMSLIGRIMSNQRCEVLVNFNYHEINRFLSDPVKAHDFDVLFGTDQWRTFIDVTDPMERKSGIRNLYQSQFQQSANIKYVRFFEMINLANQTEYFLFFGTNHLSGLKAMLAAMWKVDPAGAFRFSDRTDPRQQVLFEAEPDFTLLKRLIVTQFKGQTVPIELLEEFILTRGFRETHYKRQILTPMEKADPPEIEVICDKKRRKCTYPDGIRIKFL